MMPMTRQEIEILLDPPKQRNFVVSAYADPLEPVGGVAALLRAEADWAPRANEG